MSVAPPRAAAHAADGGAAQFARIDWSAPWLAQYDEPGRLLQVAALAGEAALLDALGNAAGARTSGRGRPLRFVPQAELPPGVAYETHIADTGRVPTRHNLHDFFNALVWLAYPRTKAALNARQAAAIDAAGGVGPVRGSLRDALTVFDENAALFVTAERALADALRGFDWQRLLVSSPPRGVRAARRASSAMRCSRSWWRRTSRVPRTRGSSKSATTTSRGPTRAAPRISTHGSPTNSRRAR